MNSQVIGKHTSHQNLIMQGSAFPSFESKFKESQRCINEYEKYNHILVGLRFDQDPLFNTIVARCI